MTNLTLDPKIMQESLETARAQLAEFGEQIAALSERVRALEIADDDTEIIE